jgi:hypothetical protein
LVGGQQLLNDRSSSFLLFLPAGEDPADIDEVVADHTESDLALHAALPLVAAAARGGASPRRCALHNRSSISGRCGTRLSFVPASVRHSWCCDWEFPTPEYSTSRPTNRPATIDLFRQRSARLLLPTPTASINKGPVISMPLHTEFHEDFTRDQAPAQSSDRSFGLLLAVVLAIVASWPLLAHRPLRVWAAGLSLLSLLIASAMPHLIAPLNAALTHLALLLSKITNPIITAAIFYMVFTPVALVLRFRGKDPLRLRIDPRAKSYWIPRTPTSHPPDNMHNQF